MNKDQRQEIQLPVVLPQVTIEPSGIDTLHFLHNNCDGGAYEMVAFEVQDAGLFLAFFETQGVAGAKPKQKSIGLLGTDRIIVRGIEGDLTLTDDTENGRSPPTRSLTGSVTFESGHYDPTSQTHSSVTAMRDIDLKKIPWSRPKSHEIGVLLGDLQAIPGLSKANLTPMCK